VVNPKTWQVMYHGPINDAADYGVQKASTQEFAQNAVAALLAGQPVPAATQPSKGCLVDFPERAKNHASLTYVKDVARSSRRSASPATRKAASGPSR